MCVCISSWRHNGYVSFVCVFVSLHGAIVAMYHLYVCLYLFMAPYWLCIVCMCVCISSWRHSGYVSFVCVFVSLHGAIVAMYRLYVCLYLFMAP